MPLAPTVLTGFGLLLVFDTDVRRVAVGVQDVDDRGGHANAHEDADMSIANSSWKNHQYPAPSGGVIGVGWPLARLMHVISTDANMTACGCRVP
eukprot:6044500-Pyramimonas_sp.AAC.1